MCLACSAVIPEHTFQCYHDHQRSIGVLFAIEIFRDIAMIGMICFKLCTATYCLNIATFLTDRQCCELSVVLATSLTNDSFSEFLGRHILNWGLAVGEMFYSFELKLLEMNNNDIIVDPCFLQFIFVVYQLQLNDSQIQLHV